MLAKDHSRQAYHVECEDLEFTILVNLIEAAYNLMEGQTREVAEVPEVSTG